MKKEEIVKFYEKFKLIIFPSVIALLSLMLIGLVIYPQTTRLLENQKKSAELKQKAEFLENKTKELQNYNEEQLISEVKVALTSFPAEKDYMESLGILQNIISQAGFTTETVSLAGSAQNPADYKNFNLNIAVLGPTQNLQTLLKNLEGSYRLMRLTSLETSAAKDKQSAASLGIEVLYSEAPAGYGSVDSPLPKFSEKDQEILSRLSTIGTVKPPEASTSSLPGSKGKANPFE